MSSLPLSLPVGLAFRNPRPLRPEGKSGARKTYPWWRRTSAFTKVAEMCGDKTKESDRGSQGSPGFSIAMEVVEDTAGCHKLGISPYSIYMKYLGSAVFTWFYCITQ